jgi:hypothetical protein
MYKLFLDNKRNPPAGSWTVARSYEQFKEIILNSGIPALISFDYDLTDDWKDKKTKTGMACANWLIDHIIKNELRCPEFLVHSQNTAGARKIREAMTAFQNNMA